MNNQLEGKLEYKANQARLSYIADAHTKVWESQEEEEKEGLEEMRFHVFYSYIQNKIDIQLDNYTLRKTYHLREHLIANGTTPRLILVEFKNAFRLWCEISGYIIDNEFKVIKNTDLKECRWIQIFSEDLKTCTPTQN